MTILPLDNKYSQELKEMSLDNLISEAYSSSLSNFKREALKIELNKRLQVECETLLNTVNKLKEYTKN